MKNGDTPGAVSDIQRSQKTARMPVVKGPLLGLIYILSFPFIGLATALFLCARRVKRSATAWLHRDTKVVTVAK